MPAIAIYDPQKLIEGLRINPAPLNFLQKTFFRHTVNHETSAVQFDVEIMRRRISRPTNPSSNARVVERKGYKSKSVEPMYFKDVIALRPKDFQVRLPNEDPYHPMTVEQRQKYHVGEAQRELDAMFNRSEELLCAKALLTGKVHVFGDGYDHVVDYEYVNGTHIKTLTGTSVWNHDDSNPMNDMKGWKSEINTRCGVRPNIAIVGTDVANAITDNKKVFKRLDNRRMEFGEINPQELGEGVEYLGMLKPSNLDIYTYEETYADPDTGEEVDVIPKDVVLIGSTEAGCAMHYGLIENIFSLKALRRFPYAYIPENGSGVFVQLESAPIPCIKNPGAFMVAHVLN